MTRVMRLVRWPSKYVVADVALFGAAGVVMALAHLAAVWTACILVLLVIALGVGAWERQGRA